MISFPRRSTLQPVLALLSLLLVFGAGGLAGQTLQGRIVGHALPDDVKVFEVGDVPGHTIGLVQARGLAFLDNGEVAELRATETLDNVAGEGTYQGYEVLTFEDGSTIVSRFEGENVTSDDGRFILFEGTFEYVHGTGRFEGIEGGGTHEGRNHASSGVGFYLNFEGTYSLPGDER